MKEKVRDLSGGIIRFNIYLIDVLGDNIGKGEK